MNWRQIFEHSPMDCEGRNKVRCTVCDKILVHNHSTWGTLKRHAQSHIATGYVGNIRATSLQNLKCPIRQRHHATRNLTKGFKILSPSLKGDRRFKCLICGVILRQTDKSSTAIKRHQQRHQNLDILEIKILPAPFSSSIGWRIKHYCEANNKGQYRIELSTNPKIKGWLSELALEKLQQNLGQIELPANTHLIHKLKLKRDTKEGPEIFVEFNTFPTLRLWIAKKKLRQLKEIGLPIRI